MAKPLTSLLVTIQTESGIEQRIVDENPFTIGRSLESAIAFSDTNVSRIHVLVKNKTGKVWIEDQGSANGTLVNGSRLTANRLTPIEAKDRIRLGNTTIELSIVAVEKAFSEQSVEDAPLAPNERDAVLNLIHGAHAEAQRLVRLGKEVHDNIVKISEERARALESKMVATREHVLAQAREQAQAHIEQANIGAAKIVANAEEQAKKAVLSIHDKAREIKEQADTYRRELTKQATVEAKTILEQQEQEAQELLEAAKVKIQNLENQAKAEIKDIRIRAEREATHLIEEAKHEGERHAAEYMELTKAETQRNADKILNDARIKALEERDNLMHQAEDQINALRLERRRQESELNLQIKRLEGDLKRLQGEVEDQDRLVQQKRKVAEDEVKYLHERAEAEAQAIFNEKRQELESLREDRLKEVEKIRAAKEEETTLLIQSRLLEFEKRRHDEESKLQNIKAQIDHLDPQITRLKDEESKLIEETQQMRTELSQISPQVAELISQATRLTNDKTQLEGQVKELESRHGHLALAVEAENNRLIDLQSQLAGQVAEAKQKHGAELANLKAKNQEELDQIRLKEMEQINKDRVAVFEEMMREKDKISHLILSRVESEVVRSMEASSWRKMSDQVASQIKSALEEATMGGLTDHHADIKPLINANKSRHRTQQMRWLTVGIVSGVLSLWGVQYGYERFQQDTNPMKTAAEQDARARQEDLERRKFNPPQDPALRETYADCVIYTQDYLANYLNADYQKEWLKAATTYLLKQWRVQEETSVQVLSTVNTLITTLNELKGKIHPDYIPQGLKKMTDLEAETLTKVKDMLGSEVRLEAFRRLEKRFYTSHFLERAPADEGSKSDVQ